MRLFDSHEGFDVSYKWQDISEYLLFSTQTFIRVST